MTPQTLFVVSCQNLLKTRLVQQSYCNSTTHLFEIHFRSGWSIFDLFPKLSGLQFFTKKGSYFFEIKMLSRLLVLTGLAHAAATITKEALADKIVNLPGTEKLDVNFNQYSGYLAIPGTTGELTKHMHYWYVESLNHPAVDPLAFWTNGGPGCSGLIGAFHSIHKTQQVHFELILHFLIRFYD
jgi:hypothetical protein